MPGFVDLQVNGYAGVDFNDDDLTLESMLLACQRLRQDGVDQILATIITAPLERMAVRIAKIAGWLDAVAEVREVVAGIHVEGPFINPVAGFVGAHPVAAVLPATLPAAQRLLQSGGNHVRLVTLAPECDPGQRVIDWVASRGVIVAAGHSNASLAELDRAIDAGLTLFTHLGNGCPAQLDRHDNIISRVLRRSDRLMISLIADGHHIPVFALANYLRVIPPRNVIIVSDAIAAAGLGPGQYSLAGQRVWVDPDGAAWAACRTHYAGCATTLKRTRELLRASVTDDEATLDAYMIDNPSRLLRSAAGD